MRLYSYHVNTSGLRLNFKSSGFVSLVFVSLLLVWILYEKEVFIQENEWCFLQLMLVTMFYPYAIYLLFKQYVNKGRKEDYKLEEHLILFSKQLIV